MEFWYKAYNDYYTESFQVGYSTTTNDASAFTWGTEITTNNTSYQKYEGLVPAGTKYVCIKYTANDQYFLFIDDILIQEPPTCLPVTNLILSDADSTSLTLSWSDTINTGASYSLAYWTTPGDTTWITDIFTTTYQITNLTPSTSYNVLLRATCSATDSSVAVTASFRTTCGQMEVPFSDNFDSYENGVFPPCWTRVRAHNTDPSVNNVFHHSGTLSMYLKAYNDTTLFVSPSKVPLAGDQIYVSYWAYMAFPGASYTKWIKAGVMTDINDLSTFITLDSIGNHNFNYEFEEHEFSTAGLDPTAEYWVAWMYYNNYYAYYGHNDAGAIDDVIIRQDNGCNKPNMAVVDSVGPYTAYLSWTTGGASATAYDLFYSTSNSIDSALVETVTDLDDTVHYALSGLLPQTTYYAWVRTACGSDSADVKAIGSFTTQLTCAPLLNATMGNISYTAAQITWEYDTTQGFPSEGVQITLVDNTDSLAEAVVVEVTGTSYTFSDLVVSHSYTATLRNMCEAESQTDTAAAVSVNFMTMSCSEVAAGTGTSTSAPMNCYYSYSYSQSIYTPVEMPNVDSIHGIAYYTTGSDTKTIEVYMGYTTLSTLSTSSYVPIEDLSKVADTFSFSFTPGWNVINFDSAFFYDRTQGNLVIAVNNLTGGWTSNRSWATHATDAAQTVYWYQDASAINLASPTASNSSTGNYVPAVRFVAECEVPECFAPMLSLGDIDSTSISLNWVSTGTESEWAIGIKAEGTTAIVWNESSVLDTFYTFENLSSNTSYTLYVGSLCSGDTLLATITAKTACGVMTLPYSTSFEGDVVNEAPACWTVINSYAYQQWDYSTYDYINIDFPAVSTGARTGSKSLGFITQDDTILIASSALPAEGQSLMISFWAQSDDDYSYATLALEAGLMTDLTADSTFVPYVTLTGSNDYTNYEFATPVLNSDSTYYLAFRYISDYTWGTADVDDIEIRIDDGCHRSTNVVAFGIDTSEIEVNWDNDGEVNSYVLQYRLKDSTEWTTVEGLTATSCTLSLLATATAYEVRVGTVCTDDTLWTLPVVGKTTCAPMVLPYTTSFETDIIGDIPACWSNIGVIGTDYYGATYPSVASGNGHTGTKSLTFEYIQGSSIVSSDAVPLPGDSIHVSFWAKLEGSTYYGNPTIEAGVMTNPTYDSTFIPLLTVTGNLPYTQYEFNTSTLPDETYYVAFRYISASQYIYAYIDDINIREDDGCMYPANVTAVGGANDIVVTWTNPSYSGNFIVQYSTNGAAWSTPHATSTSTSDTITGLNAATTYDILLGNVCGGDTLWASTSASTNCAIFDVPYYEPFYSATMDLPLCWDFTDRSLFAFNNWVEAPGIPGHAEPGDGTLMARSGSAYEYAILPELNAPFTKLQISFKAKLGNVSEGDSLVFGVYDDVTETITIAGKMAHPAQNREVPVLFTYNFLDYNGSGNRIAISHSHNNPNDWGFEIDSLVVIALPDCLPPTNVAANNTLYPNTANDVYFNWNRQGNAAQWQVYLDTITSTIDIEDVDDSLLITVYDTVYQPDFGTLAEGAKYRFFVRSDCGYEHSNWVELQNGAATDEVWMNNTGVADIVTGCDFIVYDNGGPVSGYMHNSNSVLTIQSGEAGREVQIQGGRLDFGAHTPSLNIYDGTSATGTPIFSYNEASTSQVYTSPIATSTTGALTITFTSGYAAAAGYEFYVHCVGQASCERPSLLHAEMTSTTQAEASWNGSAPNYNFYYRLSGSATWVMQTVSTNSITLTGLASDTTYEMYVVALCSAFDTSIASIPFTLRTVYEEPRPDCEPVSNLQVSNVTHNMAVLSWTAVPGQNHWEINYGDNLYVESSNTNYTFRNLHPSTTYTVKVRALCNDELASDWSDEVTFTTEQNPQGIDDVTGANIALFPNPASNTVTLTGIESMATVTIVDMNGRVVYTHPLSHSDTQSLTIDVSQFAQGAYFVHLGGEQVNAIRKLIVK